MLADVGSVSRAEQKSPIQVEIDALKVRPLVDHASFEARLGLQVVGEPRLVSREGISKLNIVDEFDSMGES